MPSTFTVDRNNEFFLAIGKQGIHTFLMMGVLKEDGSPQLLARVGKTNEVDPVFPNELQLFRKELFGNGALAMILDEGIYRSKEDQRPLD